MTCSMHSDTGYKLNNKNICQLVIRNLQNGRNKMKVFLFKSTNEDTEKPDKFEASLKSENISVEIIPVITFDFSRLDNLWEKLQFPENYQGIIFSSPRCVQSIKKSLDQFESFTEAGKWESTFKSKWINKWLFCVGPATAEVAARIFENSSKIVTSEDGNAESLGQKIIEVLKSSGQINSEADLALLYPCGNLKRDTLQNMLLTNDIKTDPIVVYETVENPNLSQILSLSLDLISCSNSSSYPFVFFSPSGLKTVIPYLKDYLLKNDRPLISLGPTTNEALMKVSGVNSKNVFQCKSPTPEGLLEVLKSL